MSNQTQINATGASGAVYTFVLWPLNSQFPASGGVYLILKQNIVLYVGQTGDLSERFDSHHKKPCWRRHQADRMAVLCVTGENDRLRIETDLIRSYNPVCND